MDGDRALDALDKALKAGGEGKTRDDVLAQILTGKATVINGRASFLICTLHESEGGSREAHAWAGGGDLQDLCGPVKALAEKWARINGASVGSLGGRKGWARMLRDYGGDDELRKVL